MPREANYREFLDFLDRLRSAHIVCRTRHSPPHTISVDVDLPTGRWEVDFDGDGVLSVQVFVRRKDADTPQLLSELEAEISDRIAEQTAKNSGI